jgi:hypothetical protein
LPGFKGGKDSGIKEYASNNTVPLGRRYWQAQSNTPTILEKKNTWVKQQKAINDRNYKAFRKWFKTEGVKELNKEVKDYLTTSNDNTWTTANRSPKNPHLQARAIKGAKAHALWEKEHPVLNTWGNVLGAVPFAVASAPLVAAAGSGMAALGDAVAATSAGQAITAGLTPLATAASTNIAGAPLYTWADVGLSSLFGGHGIQTAINEGGISPTTALEVAPLGRLARPLYKSASNVVNFAYNRLPWTYRIPENPNMAYRRMGPLERDWLMEGNELGTRAINPATELEREAAVAAEKAKNPNRRFVLFKAGAEHGGRKQFAKGQPWRGTTVTHGEEQVLAIPGEGLPWVSGRHFQGPQGTGFGVGDISFEEAPFGSHIDLLTNEGYSGVNPSLLDGSVIYSPYKIFGRNFGYKKLYPKITTPQITAENATSITPEQWTAAQDAAIVKGDMAEAQRLRDLHSSLTDSATPGKYYRGTQTKRNSYPDRHIDEEVGEMNGIYLTKKPKYAKTYGDVEEFYLRSNNPLKTEGSWTGVIDDATRAEIENAGYDAVVNNRFDTGFLNKLLRNSRDETITFNGKNLKLADAVTYDDKGVRIPLGLRDNFKLNDIRYGLVPFGVGLTGYGLLKNQKTSGSSARKGKTKK